MLVCHTRQTQIDCHSEIVKKIRDGEISEDVLDSAVARILREKKAIAESAIWEKTFDEVRENIASAEHKEIANSISRKSVTLARHNGFLPL